MRSIWGKARAASIAASGSWTESKARCSVTGRPGCDGQHRGDQVEVERAFAREADHRAVDAEIGEVGECPLQRDQFTRAGDAEPVALADHHAQRQGSGGDDRADEIERWRQAVALDLADDFQPVGAAGLGFRGVGDRLNDDFEKNKESPVSCYQFPARTDQCEGPDPPSRYALRRGRLFAARNFSCASPGRKNPARPNRRTREPRTRDPSIPL